MGQGTFVTLRRAGHADVAPVQDEPMVRLRNQIQGNMGHKVLFYRQRRGGCQWSQPDAVRNAKHVRVHGHRGLIENDGSNDVGRLATHARQSLQFVHLARYFGVEFRYQHPARPYEVLAFIIGIRY